MNLNTLLIERVVPVIALAPVSAPTGVSPRWVSLKNFERATVIIQAANATTVTGSAIALSQAQDVAGTGAKTLPFALAYRNIDVGAAASLTEFAVTSNTFTTDATNSKNLIYGIEVKQDDLDVNNGFDCMRVTIGNGVAVVLGALYLLWGGRYGGLNKSGSIVD